MKELLFKLEMISEIIENYNFKDDEFEFMLEMRNIIKDRIVHLVIEEYGYKSSM